MPRSYYTTFGKPRTAKSPDGPLLSSRYLDHSIVTAHTLRPTLDNRGAEVVTATQHVPLRPTLQSRRGRCGPGDVRLPTPDALLCLALAGRPEAEYPDGIEAAEIQHLTPTRRPARLAGPWRALSAARQSRVLSWNRAATVTGNSTSSLP